MRIQFLGAAHEVTGSCTLLEACGKKILIDCGMEQGADIYENCELPVAPGEIDYLFLTHAHIDHSGKIPALSAGGFSSPVYATEATCKLCKIMLLDSAHIQEFEAQWRNRKAKRSGNPPYVPLYTTDDATRVLENFVPCDYSKDYDICDGISIRFTDAGHLLGSASIEISVTENGETKKIVFSGDLGNIDRPLIRNPGQPKKADFLVIESTYGDRLHGERPDYVAQLTRIIGETLDRGGNVVIPSFAVGRTQELLYLIREIKEQKRIKGHDGFPVYVDSPLSVEATEIYSSGMTAYYDEETIEALSRGVNPIKFPDLKVSVTSDDSIRINEDRTPKVIISSSGMCEAGRIRHHLKHNLWRPESTILFVGYQSAGTLGANIIAGAETVKIFGEEIKVNAHIEQLAGISGHADENMLLSWIGGFEKKPGMIFVNHGEDTVCDSFAKKITDTYGIEATAPYNGAIYDLTTMECLAKGETKHIEKKAKPSSGFSDSSAFARLQSAAARLMKIIEKYRQSANKDIAKLADQIISICDKWDR